jgi:deazaflavin-dependent oxidoreductase (nitroreductase family)
MAGKMSGKPNALQRLLHLFVALPPVTRFFAPRAHVLDNALMKLTQGRFTLTEILGWDIIQLTTIGAKTRQLRTLPLVGLFDGQSIVLIASSFGREHNPGWYYNLKANPECEVLFKGKPATYIAREIEGEEREKYFRIAISQYAGFQSYRERAAHRHIPVMVLEPKT